MLSVSGVEEAINFIAARPKPLALYAFSSSRLTVVSIGVDRMKFYPSNVFFVQDKVIGGTSSGGVTINDTVVHTVSHELKVLPSLR